MPLVYFGGMRQERVTSMIQEVFLWRRSQYRRILELHDQKHSQRCIAASTRNSRAKIGDTIHRAEAMGIRPPFDTTVSDDDLAQQLFPELRPEAKGREVPYYEYLYKELARPNVTLTLL